jgi:hypothetical protein
LPAEVVLVQEPKWAEGVNLKQKGDWIRVGEKSYIFHVSMHWGRKQFFAEVSVEHHDKPEFAGTKYERPSQTGDYTCFSKDVEGVLDCIRQKYGVTVKFEGDLEDLKRRERHDIDEAIAPKPHEIGLFEVMESNSEQVLEAMKKDLGRFCTFAGVGRHVGVSAFTDFAQTACKETLEGLIGNLELEIPNEDWTHDLEEGTVKRKLNEILERDRESAEYRAEEMWGVAPREPYKMAEKSKGEQIAEQIWDLIKLGERERLASVGDETARKLESQRLKDAIRLFLQAYMASMKRRVVQLH